MSEEDPAGFDPLFALSQKRSMATTAFRQHKPLSRERAVDALREQLNLAAGFALCQIVRVQKALVIKGCTCETRSKLGMNLSPYVCQRGVGCQRTLLSAAGSGDSTSLASCVDAGDDAALDTYTHPCFDLHNSMLQRLNGCRVVSTPWLANDGRW